MNTTANKFRACVYNDTDELVFLSHKRVNVQTNEELVFNNRMQNQPLKLDS